ncbi:MAG: PLP-dependent aspartate aminotransferase family protein [Gemmatimonadetes bacterium]|nr:PLP-dependent aspartate aminotransferase family protein [Gemmatimonadota bacterium]
MATSRKTTSRATNAIHGGAGPHHVGDPVAPPLVQSVNFIQEIGTEAGLLYTRYGNTPNLERVQKRLALLEGAEAALLLSSGMGATACAMMALLRPGDHLLASANIYGGTLRLLTEEFTRNGVDVTLVDPHEHRVWRKRLRKETRAVFVESPVNPTCRVIDLRPISQLTTEEGLALVVDSTFASPINLRPIEHGADVVIHSGTKFLNGHHDAMCGVVAGTESYIQEVLQKLIVWGQAADPFAAWLLERGLKTLDVRIRRQNDNAMKIATWCANHKDIKRVHYPGLIDHPDHEIARAMLDGYGAMMAIELSGAGKTTERFLKRLKIFQHAASLGGVDSLVCEPRYTSHARMSSEERARVGVPDGFIRMSIGLEDAEDLIADVEQALK